MAIIPSLTNKVLESLENPHGDLCVDIFCRDDGSFGFEEYRRDPEDGRWFSLHRYSGLVFGSQPEATSQARAHVPWLAGRGEQAAAEE